ncbi:MAG: amino-acid N-acetyltransferase [Cardiobacteriaceae bacterium]|nr:amino-acid N-acetyltransferase [Cardiobacteriaceae bacterium]
MNHQEFLHFFRQAAPYIHTHRHKTFLIAFEGLIDHAPLKRLLHDCALLHSFGVRLILVHGARTAINQRLQSLGLESQVVEGKRITNNEILPPILETVGQLRLKIEALLSMSMAGALGQETGIHVATGNFLTAKPIGVREGKDFGFAGEIRKIDVDGIRKRLSDNEIVLLSPLGFSPTGQIYNLNSEEVAAQVASALKVDKLIYIVDGVDNHQSPRQLTPREALSYASDDEWLKKSLRAAAEACEQGIRRVHLLERDEEGGLLIELFTRDGIGIMVTEDRYDHLRRAHINDINGLLELIRPFEEQGILVKRSREKLEQEIERFYILERDGTIIGCAALYPYMAEKTAELACMVVHPDYRKNQRADHLLATLENEAKALGIEQLFILTTHTAQWFEERGFEPMTLEQLPEAKKAAYNYQRNSRLYLKVLQS